MNYAEFIARKAVVAGADGIEVSDINPQLFGFQRDIVRWALRKGRAAIFADCGMGKTPMQLEFAKHIPGEVLILAPLAVAAQTVREGQKFGIDLSYAKNDSERTHRITITNYDRLDHFDPSRFSGVILDESSILKSFDGSTRTQIIESFSRTPFRLACTATPAPNDFMELGNHAEFLGAMTRTEMLSMFFVHDGGETQKWRLKGHAERRFWDWVCSWAVALRKPSDLGYPDDGFVLPTLDIVNHQAEVMKPTEGFLFALPAMTLDERIAARRDSIEDRADTCAAIVNASSGPFIVWCNLNSEGDALKKRIPGAVEIRGSDSAEFKESSMVAFAEGRIRVLITKPSIAGFGMNWQHCHQVAFVGLSDSYEQFYQAVRRCWRFGQEHPVKCHIITASTEGEVLENIQRKESDAQHMGAAMIEAMRDISIHCIHGATSRFKVDYKMKTVSTENYDIHLGDCVEVAASMPDNSLDYSIYSPPFASLYTYSASDRDMGNCAGVDEFAEHYRFLVRELYRAMKPGRLVSFHCMNLPTSKVRDGYIGIHDFRGDLIRIHEAEGWIYHSEVCIWKDPVTAMQRTKAIGLLHKQLKKDSALSRQGIPDYLVTMRKPGENPDPIDHDSESFPVQDWQKIASPVWMDINPSDTLQYRSARDHKDERHIAPLQLEVIRRALRLWSRPGDLVFSPFAGIGSEGYVALQMGRRFVGSELKESYWNQAVKNLASTQQQQALELA